MPERIMHPPLESKKIKQPKAEIHIIKDQCKGAVSAFDTAQKRFLKNHRK